MGGRKTRKAPPKKAINKKLSTQFSCPFCNHEKSIDVKIQKTSAVLKVCFFLHGKFFQIGFLFQCSKCGESYETQANYLSEPIDIYAEWLDEIAAANESKAAPVQDEYEEE
jgi:transcription elongation factor Elf1